MTPDLDAWRTLEQLARLLRRRFGRSSVRTFVLLAASPCERPVRTEDAVTQRLPMLRSVR